MNIVELLVKEFKFKQGHIENVIKLLDEGNTIPFIARYRKEQTGEMEDSNIRSLANRLDYLRNLISRKEEVRRLISEQGKLTEELDLEISRAETLQRLEDLYRPYRQKRRTRATMAKEKGLDSLAEIILKEEVNEADFDKVLLEHISEEKGVNNEQEALDGAMDIIAELVSDDADYRKKAKDIIFSKGIIITEGIELEEDSVYSMYNEYKEAIKSIANHRILAINRGEKDKKIKVKIDLDHEEVISYIRQNHMKDTLSVTGKYIGLAIEDGYKRLLYPSIEREIRNNLTERAEDDAIKVFSLNLEPLLMQAPLRDKVVMAIDPGYRTGCKVAIVDEIGKILDYTVVYPTKPQNRVDETKKILKELINTYNVHIIAIGNGTASRETESVVGETLRELDREVFYIIVSEAGASIYSASEVGIKEFPNLDVTIRGAISIGRRLQDPLAELVKIDPKHIGVGQYQHDLNQGKLDGALAGVVENAVNMVGVDLNTASPSLLGYVAGISTKVASNLLKHREEKGRFKSRKELLNVKGLGPKTFQQCAGFLRIRDGENPLDNTGVHPESYGIAKKVLELDYKNIKINELSRELEIGKPTLIDIIRELEKPGRDPRDEMPKPILRQDVLSMEDLEEGMILKGTVRNVVDFGAFVDIGVKEDGLVHISQLSNKFIKHPKDLVTVGDIVEVKIIEIDIRRGRISLSMKNI